MRRPGRFSVTACAFTLTLMGAAAAESLSPAREAYLTNLLLQDCGSCHGLTMKGGLGPALLPDRLSAFTDDDLVEAILHGRPGTPMPPWASEISAAEARWMVRLMKEGVPRDD